MKWLRVRSLTAFPGYEPSVGTLYYPALLFCLFLAGCATVPQSVSVSCVKEAPEKPVTTDETAIRSMDDYAATITVWTERLLLKAYAEKADAVIQACR